MADSSSDDVCMDSKSALSHGQSGRDSSTLGDVQTSTSGPVTDSLAVTNQKSPEQDTLSSSPTLRPALTLNGLEGAASPLQAHPSRLDSPSKKASADLRVCEKPSENRNQGQTAPLERLQRRLASAYFAYFLCGWGDGVTGTVLPYMQTDYNLTYMTSSLLFVSSTIGFFIAALIVERVVKLLGIFHLSSNKPSYLPACPLASKLIHTICSFGTSSHCKKGTGYSASQGRFVTLILASVLHASTFVILGSKSGFASVLVAYATAAFSRAFLSTILNSYVASTPSKPLGYLLGFWSFGGFASPFVCQALIAAHIPWPRFYFDSLVVSAVNLALIVYAFRPTQAEFEREKCEALCLISRTSTASSASEFKATTSLISVDAPAPANTLRTVLSMPYQWAFSFFAFLYYGCEITVVGLTVTFLLGVRKANPATVGYVTSGFWAGMCVSRYLWGHYSPSLSFTQRKYIIHACLFASLVMNLLICFVTSHIVNSVCISIVGLMYGPVFPSLLVLANDVLPSEVHMVSMALICAFAGLGAALLPFLTGLLSTIEGIGVFPYVTIAQSASTFVFWALFPSKRPSSSHENV